MSRTPRIGITTYGRNEEGRFTLGARYVECVRRAGGLPLLLPPGEPNLEEALEIFDAFVMCGGPDVDPKLYGGRAHAEVYGLDPERDASDIALARVLVARRVPALCICRGVQVLNVALGGSLYQHIPDDPGTEPHGRPGEPGGGRLHDVTIDADSRLAQVMGTTTVTASCHHHQAIDKIGHGLHVVARAADGIVEALELDHPEQWLLAVQWHPEDTAADDPAQQNLFDTLVAQVS